jgi:hypothetical protein
MKKRLEWAFADELMLRNRQALLGLFLVVGVLTRVIRYYLCFPLWDDESFLCVNFIHRSYAELLQPLDYHQVAPILFLWIERTAVMLLGFSEYALRLIPFICSIVSLFLFKRVTAGLLSDKAQLFAVAVFAVSYPGIRYAAEAKPYGTDLFVSLVMLWLVVEWHMDRNRRRIFALAAIMPFFLGISYPAVFAAGGLSLVTAGVLFRNQGTKSEWVAWVAWNLSIIVSFGFWFFTVARIQSGAEAEFMGEYWKINFPPVHQPWLVPFWLLKTHASDFLAYPVGGPNWASTLTFVICVIGLLQPIRTKQLFLLGLLFAPAGLHLFAAALQKYPYGGHVKFSQYLAPMICCLIGMGIARCVEWNSKWGISSARCGVGYAVVLFAIGIGSLVRDLASPFKTRSDFRARAFAQSFWPGTHSVEEVACVKSDLGLDFVPEQHKELSWSAHYLCNRAIEISRSSLHPADPHRVSTNRPLRCVLYRDARFEVDQARLDRWLVEMQRNYELIAHESLPFPRMAKGDRKLVTMEYVDSYKFIPRDAAAGKSPLAVGPEALKN